MWGGETIGRVEQEKAVDKSLVELFMQTIYRILKIMRVSNSADGRRRRGLYIGLGGGGGIAIPIILAGIGNTNHQKRLSKQLKGR
jgi:hypothetical protein